MTRRHLLAAGLLALLPAAVPALDWTLRAGVLYDRSDTWTETTPTTTQPRLDLDLRLDLRGSIGGPGVVAFGGSAGYRYTTIELNGARTDLSTTLTYKADAALFQNRKSPVNLTLFASRDDGTFETSAGTVAGDRVTDNYGATLRLIGAQTPDLALGYMRNAFDERIGADPIHTRSTDSVIAQVSHSVNAFGLGASYRGDWSDGTWVADQYESHEVNFVGSVLLGGDRELTLVDRYYARAPTTDASGAFGLDSNAFRATLRLGRTPGDSTTLDYSDRRQVTETSASFTEAITNSLRYTQDFRIDRELFVRAVADVSATQERTGAVEVEARGGTVGPELWWRKVTDRDAERGVATGTLVEFSAGPLVGATAVRGEPTRLGYGGVFRARASGPWASYDLSGSYEVTYGTDLFGRPGWTLDQSGSATIGGAGGAGRFNLQATLLGRRSYAPLLGDQAANSFTLLGNYALYRYTAFAQAGVANGVLPGTEGFVGDGIFVPTGLKTQSASASGGLSVILYSGLTARVSAGYLQSYLPGQPDLTTLEGNAALFYRYGAFQLSLEDRITQTGNGTDPFIRNVLFVRVSRAFGSRY